MQLAYKDTYTTVQLNSRTVLLLSVNIAIQATTDKDGQDLAKEIAM